jgi:hypothetical protein
MVTIDCPWCEQEEPLALATLEETEAAFCCPDCGTTVQFVDEAAVAFDLAA